ncbi:hypothetical protein [Actinokineospora sp. NPDC004072]
MSPKRSHDTPGDDSPEPEEPQLPPGYVPTTPPAPRPAPQAMRPWVWYAGLAVVVAAVVAGIVVLAQPEDPRDSAQGTADLVATALSNGDKAAFASYTCYPDEVALGDEWAALGKATVLAVAEYTDVAKATLTISEPVPADLVLLMSSEDDSPWCVLTPALCPVGAPGSSTPSPLDLCVDRPGRP